MITDEERSRGKSIQRRTGLTFHIATRLFPSGIRHATYVLYGFFRIADEVVDDPDPPSADAQLAALTRIRRAALGEIETDDAILKAFQKTRERHDIPANEVNAFIDAMERDSIDGSANPVEFEDEAEMATYLRGSAVAVGYMMMAVMDPARPEHARPHAKALGEAFQLTNFLRDVREDIERYGRVYIPGDTLDRHGADAESIVAGRMTPALRNAIFDELRRAEDRYRTAVAGIRYLPQGCQFPVLLASVFYAEYHRLIRENEGDVLADPPELSIVDYVRLLARTVWHWYRVGDPEYVFYRVSAIAPRPGRGSTKRTARSRVLRRLQHATFGWFD